MMELSILSASIALLVSLVAAIPLWNWIQESAKRHRLRSVVGMSTTDAVALLKQDYVVIHVQDIESGATTMEKREIDVYHRNGVVVDVKVW